jgi:uncharacterized protein YjgD (DUF1641 family)
MASSGLSRAGGRAVSEPIREVAPSAMSGPAEPPVAGDPSVRHFLELLRLLDERGVLRLVRDLVEDNEELVRVGVAWLSRPENLRAIQSARALLRALQQVDPAQLEATAERLTAAIAAAAAVPPESARRGAWAVLRQLGEPDANRGLQVLLAFLRALGASSPPKAG